MAFSSTEPERIPTYAESTRVSTATAYPSTLLPSQPQEPQIRRATPISDTVPTHPSSLPAQIPTDAPPAYTPLNTAATTFTLHHTFIHASSSSPSGSTPAYQLSCPLDQRIPTLRLRRLRPKEISSLTTAPQNPHATAPIIPFDYTTTLYEVSAPPLGDGNVWNIKGLRRGAFPGTLEMKWGLKRWRVWHRGTEILGVSLGNRGGGASGKERKGKSMRGFLHRRKHSADQEDAENEAGPRRGRSSSSAVHYHSPSPPYQPLAHESATSIPSMSGHGMTTAPVLHLEEGLDDMWRELVIFLWVTRLWVAVGREKTAYLAGW